VSLPTAATLAFAMDHARARDAVQAPADFPALEAQLLELDRRVVMVESAAPDRATYLRRPDLGRRLSGDSRARLERQARKPWDLAIVVGDGLSSQALEHAPGLIASLASALERDGLALAPLVLARQARVALGDEVCRTLRARMVLVLIGERPGLSSPDSLGAYLTFDPQPGQTDAGRNCVSNIRPAGLPPAAAAKRLAWLVREARRLGLTGVALKDDSDLDALERPSPTSPPHR